MRIDLNSQGKALYQGFVKKDKQRLTIQSTDTSCSLLLQKSTCYKRLYYNMSLYTTDHDERTLPHYKSEVDRNPFDNDEFPIHYDYSLCEWCSRLYEWVDRNKFVRFQHCSLPRTFPSSKCDNIKLNLLKQKKIMVKLKSLSCSAHFTI